MELLIKEKELTIKEKYIFLLEELYRSFDFFNKHFCKGELRRPIITLQGDKRPNSTYGWFGHKFWGETKNPNNEIDELNLTAETLHREPTHVLETLLHEMAHLKNAQHGIKDCTPTQYHNGKFKEAAENFGLKVEKMQNRGWATTSLGEKAITAIELLKPKKDVYSITHKPKTIPKKLSKIISLQVDISYSDIIADLMNNFDKKQEMAEEALKELHRKLCE